MKVSEKCWNVRGLGITRLIRAFVERFMSSEGAKPSSGGERMGGCPG